MNAETQVLFVSNSAADELVLNTLLARDPDGGTLVTAVADAQAFYDAVYSERHFHIIIVDDRQGWSDWKTVVTACARQRPNALLLLLVAEEIAAQQVPVLAAEVAAVYPRNSAGLVAMSRLIRQVSARDRNFSLHRDHPKAGTDESAVQDQQRLVYSVSHDLQDPLQLARRYAEVLHDDFAGELGEPGAKVLGHLQFNLNRTQEMLDELLDYSRLQSSSPDRRPVDLNELLDEVSKIYKLTLQEIGGSITRANVLPVLAVDRRQFLRLFQNLIGNAIKFRGEQPLHITVRAQKVRDEWRIGIKDNGIGIVEEDAQRIFGMFERAASADGYPGSGMGLAICKRIVQNHNGKIWVRSTPGNGSVFIFSIPQAEQAAEVMTA